MLQWLATLGDSAYAEWVRESLWGWPISLTFHAFGNAAVVGLSYIIVLRLFGMFSTIPFTSLSYLFPIIWTGIVCQVLSGVSLWMTKPDKYVAAGMFDAKFTFVVIGVVLTSFFQKLVRGEAAAWEAKGRVTPRALRLGAATALVWSAVLMTGRLTAYLTNLYGL